MLVLKQVEQGAIAIAENSLIPSNPGKASRQSKQQSERFFQVLQSFVATDSLQSTQLDFDSHYSSTVLYRVELGYDR